MIEMFLKRMAPFGNYAALNLFNSLFTFSTVKKVASIPLN